MADDVILKGSTSCRRLVLLLWIVAEIASQNIIEAWKRKFQVLPAYIIANSGEGEGGAEHKAVRTVRSWCMHHFATRTKTVSNEQVQTTGSLQLCTIQGGV